MSQGCNYVVAHERAYNFKKKKYEDVSIFCQKLTADGLFVCPKHDLFLKDEAAEPERKKERSKANRIARKERRAELAASPLASVNPLFSDDNKRQTGYQK